MVTRNPPESLPVSLRAYWKVPRRAVYCTTFREWLRAMVWIFFVLKVFPQARDHRGENF